MIADAALPSCIAPYRYGSEKCMCKCDMNYACSIGDRGGQAGSFDGHCPAIISQAAGNRIVDVNHTPMSWMSSKRAAQTTAMFAAAER